MSTPKSQDTIDATATPKSSEAPVAKQESTPVKPKNWVQFEEETPPDTPGRPNKKTDSVTVEVEKPVDTTVTLSNVKAPAEYSGAVIIAESVHVNVERSGMNRSLSAESTENIPDARTTNSNPKSASLKTIDLHDVSNGRGINNIVSTPIGNIRQGFANGDTIVTLLPVNTRWPWITPAKFRPELVPEELMAQGLTLTVEDYVHIMELLVNDVRFNMYNICYKRILVLWIFTAFVVLLGLLFSGVTGLTLFGLGVMWLVLNAAAIFLCMFVKIRLNHNLEKCMAQVNKHLLRHKILLGLDDRGKISCHKVNLCFIYFDTTDCIKKLQEVIEREEREGRIIGGDEAAESKRRQELQQRMDIDDSDIVIQGSTTTRLSRKQERAELLLLRYASRWAHRFVRRRLDLVVDSQDRMAGRNIATANIGLSVPPRHCVSARCPCQFIEDHLKYKPRAGHKKVEVAVLSNPRVLNT
ncbi:transmembrane protein 268 isoform X2 [Cephus cinctus]|uniref:Transmembrane protein 268 isoform X2 n=1 Tax=Cephus cinctus TaxID=211228 RepID=A0AAJ7FR43_CEPCN|nr:transmembrane protein 268 isoform X2 [Cephus cinctus]XP_015604074.1 transmembrane protein 268 isoform X2 [Cephus cinctus]